MIGLFGGRFDPVHRAHLLIARAAADSLNLEQVRWIVSGEAEHKSVIAKAADRLEMVRMALAEVNDPRMVIDDREIVAKAQGRSNYTADTLMSLREEFPEERFIWILGEDQLKNFKTWSRWQWLITQIAFAVYARTDAKSAAIAQELEAMGAQIHWIGKRLDSVSSTLVRQTIREHKPIDQLVSPSVAQYITRHHIYK